MGAALPISYKPDLAEKVKCLAEHQNKMDPAFYCAPQGFPRVGPPTEIIQNPKTLVFLYDTVNSSEQNAFRVVSTDGRPHDPTLNPSSRLGDKRDAELAMITAIQSGIGKATR